MFGGVAGYRPRVRSAYDERVYVHSPEGQFLYRKGLSGLQMPEASGGGLFCKMKMDHRFAPIIHAANAASIPPKTNTFLTGGLSRKSDTTRPVAAPANAKPIIA